MPEPNIDAKKAMADFCRRHKIRKLSLFGSILREDFCDKSDVDVLFEFEPDKIIGFEILNMEEELSQLFGGRRIDIVSEKYLNPRLRKKILDSAEVQYAEG